ncbi:MAG: hypothetical protein R3D89_10750 [Sphingomonadaceae bacterium]
MSLDAFFYTLSGLVLWTSFLTYHDLKKDRLRYSEADTPFHLVARWILTESKWAASLPEHAAQNWVKSVSDEMVEKLGRGILDSWGVHKFDNCAPASGPSDVPYDYYTYGNVRWDLLDSDTPLQGVYHQKHVYRKIRMSSAQIRETWPPRGRLSLWRRNRPIDRVLNDLSVIAKWANQDAAYAEFLKNPAYGPYQSAMAISKGLQDELESE